MALTWPLTSDLWPLLETGRTRSIRILSSPAKMCLLQRMPLTNAPQSHPRTRLPLGSHHCRSRLLARVLSGAQMGHKRDQRNNSSQVYRKQSLRGCLEWLADYYRNVDGWRHTHPRKHRAAPAPGTALTSSPLGALYALLPVQTSLGSMRACLKDKTQQMIVYLKTLHFLLLWPSPETCLVSFIIIFIIYYYILLFALFRFALCLETLSPID